MLYSPVSHTDAYAPSKTIRPSDPSLNSKVNWVELIQVNHMHTDMSDTGYIALLNASIMLQRYSTVCATANYINGGQDIRTNQLIDALTVPLQDTASEYSLVDHYFGAMPELITSVEKAESYGLWRNTVLALRGAEDDRTGSWVTTQELEHLIKCARQHGVWQQYSAMPINVIVYEDIMLLDKAKENSIFFIEQLGFWLPVLTIVQPNVLNQHAMHFAAWPVVLSSL